MMMIGETTATSPSRFPRTNPTVQIPHWDPLDDTNHLPTSPYVIDSPSSLTALHRYLPSNDAVDFPLTGDEFDDFNVSDTFSCDHFRMFEFKVRKCARGRSHDWTECPFAHPGEKARRRDPRKYHYSGTACPDFRKGGCKRGDACEYAHGVFECWLHPARYRTQPCKDGVGCTRRVCFFAHTPDQLRILPGSGELEFGSPPLRHHFDSYLTKTGPFASSPTSILASPPVSPPSESPPMSPNGGVTDLVASMRGLQLSRMKSLPLSRGMLSGSSRFGSPRSGLCSLPSTPTRTIARPGMGHSDFWESVCLEEPTMERVESGRDIRARMYEKLSKENSVGQIDSVGSSPDVGWVTELVK